MLKIERNSHCVIVYDEEANRGIAFPNTADEDMDLYLEGLKEHANVIMKSGKSGIVLIPLIFNSKPMQLFLKDNSMESILHDDTTVANLYEFYFKHAIPLINLLGIQYSARNKM